MWEENVAVVFAKLMKDRWHLKIPHPLKWGKNRKRCLTVGNAPLCSIRKPFGFVQVAVYTAPCPHTNYSPESMTFVLLFFLSLLRRRGDRFVMHASQGCCIICCALLSVPRQIGAEQRECLIKMMWHFGREK